VRNAIGDMRLGEQLRGFVRGVKSKVLRHALASYRWLGLKPTMARRVSRVLGGPWLLGMTSLDEQAFFEEYARSIYTGAGEIVDLGCWLGSTTIPLARGLSANPSAQASRKKIHAFDIFRWEAWMDDWVRGTNLEARYKPAESFLDEFKKRIAPWADQIQVYAGDLCRTGWNGGDIEFLLIDTMKSWELANTIVSTFYPQLIPKKSYILHQDFAHYYTSWIHLIQYRLRNYFRFVYAVPNSGSFVFEYVRQMPDEIFRVSYSPSSFSEQEIDDAFDYSIGLVSDPPIQAAIASAKVMLFIHVGDRPRAKLELEKYLSRRFPLVENLQRVQEQLSQDS